DLGAEGEPVPQASGGGLGEGGGTAEDAAVQALPDVPDEAEVADARSRGDLLRVTRAAAHGGAEQCVRVLRQRARVVRERAVVREVEDALLAGLRGFAGPATSGACVAQDVGAHPRTGAHECRARPGAHGDA